MKRAMTKGLREECKRFRCHIPAGSNGVKESSDRGHQKSKGPPSFLSARRWSANLRVAVLQVTAYVRASFVLDYKYMGKALFG